MHTHHRHEDAENAENKNLRAEAVSRGTTPEKIQQQPVANTSQMDAQSTGVAKGDRLHDGYHETEGQEYEQEQPAANAPDYDPTHSGVRHSRRKPGAPAAAPGRDEGTAWSEQKQMGSSTDTPQPKNPAN